MRKEHPQLTSVAYRDNYEHIEAELQWLDLLLRQRLETIRAREESVRKITVDPRLYVTYQEVDALLEAKETGHHPGPRPGPGNPLDHCERLRQDIDARATASEQNGVPLALPRLARLFHLSPFEYRVLVICLAPELEGKYEKIFVYLQDDIARKKPSVELVLDLLCHSRRQKWQAWTYFADDAPLSRYGLIKTVEDVSSPSPSSALARFLTLDPRILQFLLGHNRLDARLTRLAVKITPRCGWDDIVLADEKIVLLREICGQAAFRHRVMDEWGFKKKLSYGRGLSVLFSGPPGTGKTMAAQVIARELQLDLYRIDLSCVVSKYIGETEKNLSRIFHEAEMFDAILFFDEADALFGKRTEVSDAHDRYANIETAYLLQKMEEYEGMVILATNLKGNMDEAFTRRLRFIVEFPFPGEASRRCIWSSHFPEAAPVDGSIDHEWLARQFPVTGGSIRNIILNAAFLAARNGGAIKMEHIISGAKREYEKTGKLWPQDTAFKQ
jgi:hypothetical protein